ncbi:non-ribosomal peptide synthetase, partial [Bacillus pseudomycoides]
MQREEKSIQGLQLIPYVGKHKISKFDLTLIGIEEEGQISCMIEYATNLYKEETIKRMSEHFMQLIDAIIDDSHVKLSSLEIITSQEKTQILDVFNKTEIEYSNEKTIHQLFEEQVQRTPNQVAVVFEDQQLTYQELNERANQLARTLKAEGVRAEQLVAIMAERSLEMIIGILGVLKSGGAYVPIDPEYPEERIQYMLKDSKTQLLLLQHHLQDRIPFEGKLVNLNDEASYHKDGSNLESIVTSNQLAYVIYTSGSTGRPKGIMVEHLSIHNFIQAIINKIPIMEHVSILCMTTFSFDIFVLESLLPLVNGLKVVMADSKALTEGEAFNQLVNRHSVEVMQGTPSRIKLFMNQKEGIRALGKLKMLMIGGEAMPPGLYEQLRTYTDASIYNMYGPTETTVWSSIERVMKSQLSIGKPIANTRMYIMDDQLKLQPIGVRGELCIAGDGVTRGYLNRPDLTKEKFVENPFISGEKMYKTGDLARWLPDGSIEYLGRSDHQVKIR